MQSTSGDMFTRQGLHYDGFENTMASNEPPFILVVSARLIVGEEAVGSLDPHAGKVRRTVCGNPTQ
jgi:hypothetical protein